MATLYVDYENGNNNYGGTSFALLASGVDGQIDGTLFDSNSANFPNDGSLINQYLSITDGVSYKTYKITAWVSSRELTIAQIPNGNALADITSDRQYYIGGRWRSLIGGATSARIEPGDQIRVKASPGPTSLGINGTWTQTVPDEAPITGATNATPIVITAPAHGLATGDTVVIRSVGGNVAANGTWEVTFISSTTFSLNGSVGSGAYTSGGTVKPANNVCVKLDSAVTQTIASTGRRSNWTALTNVTTAQNTTQFKEHRSSDSIAVTGTFTTGRAAYYTLPATLDLSGYRQVSFWIYSTLTFASGRVTLRLCSDTTGQTTVNTITVPALTGGYWHPFTVGLGVNLGASIRSIALYVATDLGASTQTIYLNNIIACKSVTSADSLTLNSLISKSPSIGPWYAIQSISGTRVMLDGPADAVSYHKPGEVSGYYGTAETVTVYKRELLEPFTTAGSTATLNDEIASTIGTAASPITISGGWSRTDMATQNGYTWVDGINGLQTGISISGATTNNYFTLSRMCFARFLNGIVSGGSNFSISVNIQEVSMACCMYGVDFGALDSVIEVDYITGYGQGIRAGSYSANGNTTSNMHVTFRGIHGGAKTSSTGVIMLGGYSNSLTGGTIYSPLSYGVEFIAASELVLNDVNIVNAVLTPFNLAGISGRIYTRRCSATLLSGTPLAYFYNDFSAASLSFDRVGDANNTHQVYGSGYRVLSDSSVTKTGSGISWRIEPLSEEYIASKPIVFPLAKVACNANALVTVTGWFRRNNTALTMKLVCKGGQLNGVTSTVSSSMSAAANTWEQLTITFTPTVAGVVEITSEVYGGSSYIGYIDEMSFSQA